MRVGCMFCLNGCPRRLDLRFDEDAEENKFRNFCETDVVRTTCCMCISMSFVFVSRAAFLHLEEWADDEAPYAPLSKDPRSMELALCSVVSLWNMWLGAKSGRRWRRGPQSDCDTGRRIDWEIWALVTFALDLEAVLLLNSRVLAAIYGRSFEDIAPNVVVVHVVNLTFVACLILSVLCSFCPIRWHRLRVLPLAVIFGIFTEGMLLDILQLAMGSVFMASAFCLCQVSIIRSLESSRRESWRSVSDAKAQEEELERRYGIATDLLSSFCDCVIRLDGDLRLVEPCPQLATLLLRSPSRLASGFAIEEIMPAEEFARLRGHIKSIGGATSMPMSLTTDLLDGLGERVRFNMYFASMQKFGVEQTMVGVVEASPWEVEGGVGKMSSGPSQWGRLSSPESSSWHRSVSEESDPTSLRERSHATPKGDRAHWSRQTSPESLTWHRSVSEGSEPAVRRSESNTTPRGDRVRRGAPPESSSWHRSASEEWDPNSLQERSPSRPGSDCEVNGPLPGADLPSGCRSSPPELSKPPSMPKTPNFEEAVREAIADVEVGRNAPENARDDGALTLCSFVARIQEGREFLQWLAPQVDSLASGIATQRGPLDFGLVTLQPGLHPYGEEKSMWLAVSTPSSFIIEDDSEPQILERVDVAAGMELLVCLAKPTSQHARRKLMKRKIQRFRSDRPPAKGANQSSATAGLLQCAPERVMRILPPGCMDNFSDV